MQQTFTTATRRTVAPANKPISIADVKDHCRISGSEEDDYLQTLIDTAIALVDGQGMLGRAMINQSWAQFVPSVVGAVRLNMSPFVSLTSVQYYDTAGVLQTSTLSNYEIRMFDDYVTIQPKDNFTWPSTDAREDAIKITYVAGFGANATDVPAGIRHALKMMVAHWYENREAAGDSMTPLPLAVDALLGAERVGWYA